MRYCIFLLAFYASVIAIDVDNPVRPPNHKVILLCYLIFLWFTWFGMVTNFAPCHEVESEISIVQLMFWGIALGLSVIGVFENYSFRIEKPLYDKQS